MKKLTILLASILVLAGCSSNTSSKYVTTVDNPNDAIVTCDGVSITNQKLFEYLLEKNGPNYVLNKALNKIAETYTIDEEVLQSQVDEAIESYKNFLGDGLEDYVKTYLGYDSFEAYTKEALIPSIRQQIMIGGYVDENYETLAKSYNCKKLSMIKVADQNTAMSIINELNDSKITFAEAVEKYSTDESTKAKSGSLGIVSDLSTTVDESIKGTLPQLTTVALFSAPVSLSDGSYAVINVDEVDVNAMVEEIKPILNSAGDVVSLAETYYLTNANFQVLDPKLKEEIKKLLPNAIQ